MDNGDKFKLLSHNTLNAVLKYTPIVCWQNPPSAIPVGSSVFLKIQDDYFIISAGHLLNLLDWPELIVPGINDRMVWLNGIIATTYRNSKPANKIDFGILKFSKRQIKNLTGGELKFLNEEKIIVNHQINDSGYYLIAGFPVSGVKKKSGRAEFHPIPIKMITQPVESKLYSRNGFSEDHFILVKYQRKLANADSEHKQFTKEVRGSSGSGLWYVPDWNDRENGIPKTFLVGIMTENHKDKGFLVALRIDFITETIKQCYGNNSLPHTSFKFKDELKEVLMSEIE